MAPDRRESHRREDDRMKAELLPRLIKDMDALKTEVGEVRSTLESYHRQNTGRFTTLEQSVNTFSPEQLAALKDVAKATSSTQWLTKRVVGLIFFLAAIAAIMEAYRTFWPQHH